MFLVGLFAGILLSSIFWFVGFKAYKERVHLMKKNEITDLKNSYIVLLNELHRLRDIIKEKVK